MDACLLSRSETGAAGNISRYTYVYHTGGYKMATFRAGTRIAPALVCGRVCRGSGGNANPPSEDLSH